MRPEINHHALFSVIEEGTPVANAFIAEHPEDGYRMYTAGHTGDHPLAAAARLLLGSVGDTLAHTLPKQDVLTIRLHDGTPLHVNFSYDTSMDVARSRMGEVDWMFDGSQLFVSSERPESGSNVWLIGNHRTGSFAYVAQITDIFRTRMRIQTLISSENIIPSGAKHDRRDPPPLIPGMSGCTVISDSYPNPVFGVLYFRFTTNPTFSEGLVEVITP